MMILLTLLLSLLPEISYTQVRVYDINSHQWGDYNESKNTFQFQSNGDVKHIDVNGGVEIYKRISKPTTTKSITSHYLLTEDKFKVVLKVYPDHLLIRYEGGEEAEFK